MLFPGHPAPANMLPQGFSNMSLGATTVRPPVNTMMHPGASMGMGMAPNQGMMGMGMNMGMPQAGMTMGMGMGISPQMIQQPKHDAFADFGNFGK